MPEISLNEYFSKLNDLLSANAVDEVFLHCRHILQYFPKNVTAYRFLGRALVMNGRWDEGREALRRVLSVIPDDYLAHVGLSEANEQLGRPDEAIWHLERAFEQRPNDKDVIDALRRLYSQHRNIHNLKIQLTSAAVARQYARSGAYTQAVDTLRSAISRMNERLDLKLLLAQILWQNDAEEEAAELALEVLSTLPDCLEANKIMAQLWLGVNRPSDAQRYVNRLEAVDPYLAVELAQGYPPEDDAFRLDELDYVSTSQSEIASGKLDWLQEISSMAAPVVESEPQEVPAKQDWSDWASAMLSGKEAQPPKSEPVDEPTSTRFAAMAEDDFRTGFTDFFGQPEESDEELSALFAPAPPDRDDPMAWLHEAGVEIVQSGEEEPNYDDLFAADQDAMPRMTVEDPMAWLRDSTGDSLDAFEPAIPAVPTLDSSRDDNEADDPFSWMLNEAGVELDDVLPDDALPRSVQDTGSLNWLESNRLLNEADNVESADINSDLSWDDITRMSEEATPAGVPGETSLPDEIPVPGPRRGLTAMLQEVNFDWVTQKAEDVVDDGDMDEWLTQFGGSAPEKSVTDSPDWLTELEPSQTSGELPTWEVPEPESFEVGAADDEPMWSGSQSSGETDQPEDDGVDWMRQLTAEPEEDSEAADDEAFPVMSSESETDDKEAADDMPDWLSELAPEQESDEVESDEAEAEAASEDDFAWLSEASVAGAEEQSETADVPGWLSEMQPEPESESDSEPMLESPSVSDFPWMAEESSPDEAVPVGAEEMPDWLAEMAPAPEADELEAPVSAVAEAASDDMGWLNEESLTNAEAEAAAVSEMPDWLSEMQPEPADDSEPAAAEPVLEPPSVTDFPWMADETPVQEPAAIDSEFTWMSEEPAVTEEPDAEASGVPDWLAELQPEEASVEAQSEALPVPEEPVSWGMDEDTAAEAAAAASAAPDWLSELESSAEVEQEAEAVAESTPDWLAELESQPEMEMGAPVGEPAVETEMLAADEDDSWLDEESAAVDSVPSWLAELEPEEQEAAAETPEEDDFSWLEEEATEPEETGADNTEPAWLSEPAAELTPESAYGAYDDEDDEELVAEMIGDEFDDAEEFDEGENEPAFLQDSDEYMEPEPAHNAPDWLNAMVPGLDVDYQAEDELFDDDEEPLDDTSEREFAWLNEMVEEEMAATERPSFAFSRLPSWIAGSGAAMDDDGVDDQLPDWPSDDADADVPEWLR